MKAIYLYSILFCLLPAILFSQKKLIQQAVQNDAWSGSSPTTARISNDGHYFGYGIADYENSGNNVFFLQSADGDWKKEIRNVSLEGLFFTKDSKRTIYKNTGDSLSIMVLATGKTGYVPHVNTFHLCATGKEEWLACQLKTTDKQLLLRKLAGGKEFKYNDVKECWFADNGNVLFLNTENVNDSIRGSAIVLIDLLTQKSKTIWSGKDFNSLVMDSDGSHVAFISSEESGSRVNKIWYYQAGMQQAVIKLTNGSASLPEGVQITGPLSFGMNGRQIFFALKQPSDNVLNDKSGAAVADIWSYKDEILKAHMVKKRPGNLPAVLNIDDDKVVQLMGPNERVQFTVHKYDRGYVIIESQPGNEHERYWNKAATQSCKLISTTNGQLVKEFKAEYFWNPLQLSCGSKYVIYYDYSNNNYFSYNIQTGKIINITSKIPVSLVNEENDYPAQPPNIYRIGGWMENDAYVFIYDRYDIWMVDPTGIKEPVNITQGVGRANSTVLRFDGIFAMRSSVVKNNEKLILNAFNEQTKDRGFCSLQLGSGKKPELLAMGPYTLSEQEGLICSANGKGYIVGRMTASDAPNYFFSKDLKTFVRLTNVQPQAAYNWMTSELVEWTMFDGKRSQGILYKPEDFDPNKKYPVIFNYYRRFSDDLHKFIQPEISITPSVAYYTSNGYIVFVPDIYFTLGEPGRDAYNAVVSAAKYLSSKPWVDSARMGISGYSYGGYETNYLVTSTPIFAAACAGAGASDFVSSFGEGSWQMMYCEKSAYSLGALLWERPELYIKNSPVFKANKVTTPLLIQHNRDDTNVPFSQGLEFFLALRRLGKKVWMISYDGQGHGNMGGEPGVDFAIRQAQFFDHYLKGKPAPEWMTEGISANESIQSKKRQQ